MVYQEIPPCEALKRYVKCYFVVSYDSDKDFVGVLSPKGTVDIGFNLGEAKWESSANDDIYRNDPDIEFMGQLTKPMPFKTTGRALLLGVRFHSYSLSYFFNEPLSLFNNQVSELPLIVGNTVSALREQLLNTAQLTAQISLIDNYLLSLLRYADLRPPKLLMLERIVEHMQRDHSDKTLNSVLKHYAISSRYLQKLFQRHIGVSPKFFLRINRFQKSLRLLESDAESLTTVAYACGYYDQAHFIKDFYSFAGVSPGQYAEQQTKIF